MKIVVFIFSLIIVNGLYSQESSESLRAQLDSINNLPYSIEKVDALNEVAWQAKYIDYEIAEEALSLAFKLATKNDLFSQKAYALKIGGILEDEKGNYSAAIEKYQQAIRNYEKAQDTLGVAKCEGNIGIIYLHIKKQEEALPYFRSSYRTFSDYNFTPGVMICLQNMGICHMELKNADSSLFYGLKAKEIMDYAGWEDPKAYMNLGLAYQVSGQLDSALKYLEIAIVSYEKYAPNDKGISVGYQNLAQLYLKFDRNSEAVNVIEKAVSITDENIYNREASYQFLTAANAYKSVKNFERSSYYFELLNKVKDSIYSSENLEVISDMKAKYETEKKELEISSLNKQNALETSKRKHEEQKVFYFSIGAIIIGVLLVGLIFAFIQKAKDNKKIQSRNSQIEQQKLVLEEKNSEIIASINYAERIQNAILPSAQRLKTLLPDSFVLYEPKDIVAGDFYWLEEYHDSIYFAAADCTGHGVPGAMVSVVCNNALNKSLKENNKVKTGELLDDVSSLVTDQFSVEGGDVKDGMDIALCKIQGQTLEYSGANNPLWIIRKNEIIEVKANKQPIGKFEARIPFDTHKIDLFKGDQVYVFSDGYPDQFGGEKGKKMKTKAFKEILLDICDKPMSEQKEILSQKFHSWRGELEQIDDVCIFGVKI